MKDAADARGNKMENIRYLKQEEKRNTRRMYEAVFSEDSKAFADYYYEWKIRDNRIAVMESEEKEMEVMIHLNPYQLFCNGKTVASEYIVAVATRPDCRKQGKMYQVMEQVLKDQQKRHVPFTFLLPADPAYYESQGFVFFPPERRRRQQTDEKANIQDIEAVEAQRKDTAIMAQAANEILKEQYGLFVYRDVEYYQRLLEEVSSEKGAALLLKKQEQVIGLLIYGMEEGQAEIKELVLAEEWKAQSVQICNQVFGVHGWTENDMHMMVRITDLQALTGMLKCREEICWKVRIHDEMVTANAGCWEICKNPEGGSVCAITESETEQELDIREVTRYIFQDVPVFIREWV